MHYTYTALFLPTEDKKDYYCSVPDLPGCITTGSTLDECVDLITDAASLWLTDAEDSGDTIPDATPQKKLKIPANGICTIICVDTVAYRAETDTKAVRKNVSLPAWMVRLADKKGINCSQVLQDSLRAIFET